MLRCPNRFRHHRITGKGSSPAILSSARRWFHHHPTTTILRTRQTLSVWLRHTQGKATPRQQRRAAPPQQPQQRSSATSTPPPPPPLRWWRHIYQQVSSRPFEYATIPVVAAFVGISGNWMGVKMLFYPMEYVGIDLFPGYERPPHSPMGLLGWQGVVPTKTEPMAARLVHVITQRLLSLNEAFHRLDAHRLAHLLTPVVYETIRNDCGTYWATLLQPFLPLVLTRIVTALQLEIESILDLESLVLTAFVRDKEVLTDLFQKVGRVELKFLVESGFGFGFLLGLFQMGLWAVAPKVWTLPLAGGVVGYVTNWVAIKLLFEPAEPLQMGPIVLQGLFESRQMEVSYEFGNFLDQRVLQSHSLLQALAKGGDDGPLYSFLRRQLPFPVPAHIVSAAVRSIQRSAEHPAHYPDLHQYVTQQLDIAQTLSSRLQTLAPTEFEDLLHPVFRDDEITLIVAGGILGAMAGMLQTRLGWGGPHAAPKAVATIVAVLAASAFFFVHNDGASADTPADLAVLLRREDEEDDVPLLRRRNTLVQIKPLSTIFHNNDDNHEW